jgi:hypothetical protein
MAEAIERYLDDLGRLLTVAPTTRTTILDEVRSHLTTASAARAAEGADPATAEAQAVAAFGPAGQTATRFNVVHPLYWDRRRFWQSLGWGVMASWAIWFGAVLPVLELQGLRDDTMPASGWQTLFDATPLAFGMFRVLAADAAWFVPVFLALFGLVPFLWGARARQGWQPGLAFGLGVIIGFPWLVPGLVYRAGIGESFVQVGIVVLGIWALAPYAMLAAWLGQRILGSHPKWVIVGGSVAPTASATRRIARPAPLWLGVGILAVLLLVVNSIAVGRAFIATPTVPVTEQLQGAQARLSFTIAQPTYVPSGMSLSAVMLDSAGCSPCGVALTYSGSGTRFYLAEVPNSPTLSLHAPPNYAISEGDLGYMYPVWWLDEATGIVHQINIDWATHGIAFFLTSNGGIARGDLVRIAASLG